MIKILKLLIAIVSLLLAFSLGVTFSENVSNLTSKITSKENVTTKPQQVPGADNIIIEDVINTTPNSDAVIIDDSAMDGAIEEGVIKDDIITNTIPDDISNNNPVLNPATPGEMALPEDSGLIVPDTVDPIVTIDAQPAPAQVSTPTQKTQKAVPNRK